MAMMRFNKRWLALEGHNFPVFKAKIERDRVFRYLDFLGHKDERWRGSVCEDIGSALPTFPFSLEMEAGVVVAMASLLQVEASCLLHGEQAFTYHSTLCCGDLVTVRSVLRDVTWKPGSQVCFFGKESHFLVEERLAVSIRTVYAIKASETNV
ncbi:MaoC family dehydratase [Halomonas sp. PA16-9]|nr:MaoC family dehydratase [Halomonas sp. PA16-9]